MTVNQLRNQMTQSEFIFWAAYYENKGEDEKREMDKARNKRYTK